MTNIENFPEITLCSVSGNLVTIRHPQHIRTIDYFETWILKWVKYYVQYRLCSYVSDIHQSGNVKHSRNVFNFVLPTPILNFLYISKTLAFFSDYFFYCESSSLHYLHLMSPYIKEMMGTQTYAFVLATSPLFPAQLVICTLNSFVIQKKGGVNHPI